ncbi:MAG: hypothetical protein HC925_06690 [Coleofasciculaceae cyanobacterium SM2_3_26]|nr:hypothetical protein [Coleofasciculaceae cyanobacterium SM2_3_26]
MAIEIWLVIGEGIFNIGEYAASKCPFCISEIYRTCQERTRTVYSYHAILPDRLGQAFSQCGTSNYVEKPPLFPLDVRNT